MRFEDAGWGDDVPLPDEDRKESAGKESPTGGSPPTSGPPSKPPRAPWWRSGAGIAVGLGVLAVAAVVAVAATGGGGGGGGSTSPDPPPTTPNPGGTSNNGGSSNTGGSSTGDGSSTPLPSPSEKYLAEANKVCASHQREILDAFTAYTSSGDLSVVIAPLQSLQADLQALGTPPAEGVDTYLDDLNRWIAAFQENYPEGAQIWQTAMGTHSREAGLLKCPPN